VRAIEACLRAGVEVVLTSGRRQAQMSEDARLLGQRAYIFEAGAGMVVDGDTYWHVGDFAADGDRSIHDQIADSGAPALLLEHFDGRLEYHDPYHHGREVSHLFRGLVDAFEVDELLARRGYEGLRLVDNGVVHRRSEALAALPQVRAYHLVPVDASKSQAVSRHMRMRGYAPEETIGVGDSREDLQMHRFVGTFWLVANAVERDPTLREAMAGLPNVRVAEEGHGAGVYEAVVTTLAGA
jgi:hydroxymethylpyrimidine pyrophosphatase-like HAD family hydrolase